jgi:Skp family chaperone for outer membrane proteins
MRLAWRILRCVAVALALAGPSAAQQDVQATGVLLLDQERFFADSRFGQRIQAEIDAETKTLQSENRRIEADLEAEEKSLTERRATLPPEEFRALAEAFDAKVKGIRSARDAKSNDLAARRDAARKTFIETAVPVLAQILNERGAAAIIDRSAVVISFDRIDITDLAIARIDLLLAPEGATEAPPPRPAEPVPPAITTPPAAPASPPATDD